MGFNVRTGSWDTVQEAASWGGTVQTSRGAIPVTPGGVLVDSGVNIASRAAAAPRAVPVSAGAGIYNGRWTPPTSGGATPILGVSTFKSVQEILARLAVGFVPGKLLGYVSAALAKVPLVAGLIALGVIAIGPGESGPGVPWIDILPGGKKKKGRQGLFNKRALKTLKKIKSIQKQARKYRSLVFPSKKGGVCKPQMPMIERRC